MMKSKWNTVVKMTLVFYPDLKGESGITRLHPKWKRTTFKFRTNVTSNSD